ncbi:hypothetical protein LTR10_008616 [Elasticomyces elasticus]|nr:hypothetical protein LTR10_008616 [Elasticomyces elasticus]KAK4967487.1 hypothetical protein LTR42_010836 [Elasticomyces elasticus]
MSNFTPANLTPAQQQQMQQMLASFQQTNLQAANAQQAPAGATQPTQIQPQVSARIDSVLDQLQPQAPQSAPNPYQYPMTQAYAQPNQFFAPYGTTFANAFAPAQPQQMPVAPNVPQVPTGTPVVVPGVAAVAFHQSLAQIDEARAANAKAESDAKVKAESDAKVKAKADADAAAATAATPKPPASNPPSNFASVAGHGANPMGYKLQSKHTKQKISNITKTGSPLSWLKKSKFPFAECYNVGRYLSSDEEWNKEYLESLDQMQICARCHATGFKCTHEAQCALCEEANVACEYAWCPNPNCQLDRCMYMHKHPNHSQMHREATKTFFQMSNENDLKILEYQDGIRHFPKGKELQPYHSERAKFGFNVDQGLTDLQMCFFQPDMLIAKYTNATSEDGQTWLAKAVASKSTNYHYSRGVNNFTEHYLNPDLSRQIELDPPMAEHAIDKPEIHEYEELDEDENGNVVVRTFIDGVEQKTD